MTPTPKKVQLPWGRATVEAVVCVPSAHDPEGEIGAALQRELASGDELVRLFYRKSGRVMRGPVTLGAAEAAALGTAAKEQPALRRLLRSLG